MPDTRLRGAGVAPMMVPMRVPKKTTRRRNSRGFHPLRAQLHRLRKAQRRPARRKLTAITAELPIADEIFSES